MIARFFLLMILSTNLKNFTIKSDEMKLRIEKDMNNDRIFIAEIQNQYEEIFQEK